MSVVISEPTVDRVSAASLAPANRAAARAPLRVLTFLHSFAPGGVERIAARLHGAWTAAGVATEIVLADASIAPPRPLQHVRQIGAQPARRPLGRFAALAFGLPAQLRRDLPDVLFCAGNSYTALAVTLRIALGPACPPIVAKISNCLIRRDMPPPMRICYGIWLRIQGRYIDHFVGMAPAMRDEIAARIGVPHSHISVIADPALSAHDLARLAAARDAADRPLVGRHYLTVGRLVPQKNHALLLDAFARIARSDDTLTILGEGPDRALLERRAAALGIADAVRLPGHTDPLDRWLAQTDVFVLSSDYEGVPAVLVEALAAGVPIVATDCCVSMRDLLGGGTLGAIVPTGDAAALGAAMAAIADDTPATIAARRAVAASFTIDQAADAYLRLMETLVAGRARTPVALPHHRSDLVHSSAL
ncbi:glycosyltransferase [Sphingomonas sp. RB3P16]|uniref:glycosyltransferase n=1 Tax=Parasphingomonas frigoris TaxID=3096163 RepID=UPI002FCBDF96